MIWRYPHFRKPPYTSIHTYTCTCFFYINHDLCIFKYINVYLCLFVEQSFLTDLQSLPFWISGCLFDCRHVCFFRQNCREFSRRNNSKNQSKAAAIQAEIPTIWVKQTELSALFWWHDMLWRINNITIREEKLRRAQDRLQEDPDIPIM